MLWIFLFLQAVLADDCEIISDGSQPIKKDESKCFIIRDCVFRQLTVDTGVWGESYVIQLGYWNSATSVTVTGITMTDCFGSDGCFSTYTSGPVAISQVCIHNCLSEGSIISAVSNINPDIALSANETSFVSCGEREGNVAIMKLLSLDGFNGIVASVSISNINVSGCNIGASTGCEMISSDTAVASLRMLTISNSYCGSYNGGSVFGVNGQFGTAQSGTIEMVNVVANEVNTVLKTLGQSLVWSDSVFKQNTYQQFATEPTNDATSITLKDCLTDKEISGTTYLTTENVQVQEDPATKEISGLNTALCPGIAGDEEEFDPTSIPTAEEEEQDSPSENLPDQDTATLTLEDSPSEPDDGIPVGPGDDSNNNKRLSGGEIAGIVIGFCAAVGLIVVGAFMLFAKRRKDALLESESLG